jgi:hypothetical protein
LDAFEDEAVTHGLNFSCGDRYEPELTRTRRRRSGTRRTPTAASARGAEQSLSSCVRTHNANDSLTSPLTPEQVRVFFGHNPVQKFPETHS